MRLKIGVVVGDGRIRTNKEWLQDERKEGNGFRTMMKPEGKNDMWLMTYQGNGFRWVVKQRRKEWLQVEKERKNGFRMMAYQEGRL